MRNICLIRKGHLGDVIMTEPVARHFKSKFDNVYLATDYIQSKFILNRTYTDFIKIDDLECCGIEFETKITLTYELTPNLNYIEGFASSAGIILNDKNPIINTEWENMIHGEYILLAPNTSNWVISMRNWGEQNFKKLKERIENDFNIQVLILEDKYSFFEMLSLIRHCKILIGNDSAPGIIAQCFNIKSFIIFGATHPRYVIFNKDTTAIHRRIICIGCKHLSRHTQIQCASPFCLTELEVDSVYSTIIPSLINLQKPQNERA